MPVSWSHELAHLQPAAIQLGSLAHVFELRLGLELARLATGKYRKLVPGVGTLGSKSQNSHAAASSVQFHREISVQG